MKLYTYFRSSAAYRVRIALHLKGLEVESIPVHLLRDGGQQKQAAYRDINPLGIVPTLQTDTATLTQSHAIIEWLEEKYPHPPLFPDDADGRARIRSIAQTIACDIHPLNNLRVLKYLTSELGVTEEQKNNWYRHWIHEGLTGLEKLLANDPHTGAFCHGNQPGFADCFLVPQVANARRFTCPLDDFPVIRHIVANCETLKPFQLAAPSQQADAE